MLQKQDTKARKLKIKADEAYSQRKWEKALELYRELDQIAVGDVRVAQRIGDLCKRLNRKGEAIAQYSKAVKRYAEQGFWAKAIAMQKLILELDPNDQSVQKQLAQMYSAQNQKDQTTQPGISPASEIESIPLSSMGESNPAWKENTNYALIGGTVSIPGAAPRKEVGRQGEIISLPREDEVSTEVDILGTPLSSQNSVPLFSEMNADELFAVLERLAVRRFPKEALICEEGDVGKSMYIISEGVVEVSTKNQDGSRLGLATLRGGDFFGEYSLMTGCERNASVQAKTDVELLEMASRDLDVICAMHPRVWTVLEDYLRKRVVDTIMTKSPVFRVLSKRERDELTGFLIVRKFKVDEIVMEERTEGEEMYFVKSGKLVVMARQGSDRVVVGELWPGDYFGEVAMLTGKLRTATVRTKTDCELFCLTRKDAAIVLKNNREVLLALKSKIEERAKETVEALESYKEAKTTLALV